MYLSEETSVNVYIGMSRRDHLVTLLCIYTYIPSHTVCILHIAIKIAYLPFTQCYDYMFVPIYLPITLSIHLALLLNTTLHLSSHEVRAYDYIVL